MGNPLQTFYVLTRLASSFASAMAISETTNKNLRVSMRKVVAEMNGYNDPPSLKCDWVIINGVKYETGTVIVRPLKYKWITNVFNENHYGIVYGTGKDRKKYILENTDIRNVNYAEIEDFLTKKYSEKDISVYIKPVRTKFTPSMIESKAAKYMNEFYSLPNFNCKDFIFACILDIEPTRRTDIWNEFLLDCNNICLELDKYAQAIETDPRKKERHRKNISAIQNDNRNIASSIKIYKFKKQ